MEKNKKNISREYIGNKCKCVVNIGQFVEKNSIIAQSLDKKLNIAASVSGKVIRIYPNEIFLEYNDNQQNEKKDENLNFASNLESTKNPVISNNNNSLNKNNFYNKNKEQKQTKLQSSKNTQTKIKNNNDSNNVTYSVKNFFTDLTIEKPIETQNIKRKPVDALDGLRTFAVLSVILYHLKFDILQGGLMGVTVFFVLSGYLITGILLEEIQLTKTIKLKNFWVRRIRRLFPAIICVIVITCLFCLLFNHILLTKMKPDIIPSLCWMQNWWYIFRDMSYFDSLGDPSPLVHFWSLAIEEQFYLIWPLLLLGAYKLGLKNNILKKVCLMLALISALLMAVMYDPNTDPTRVYYGTDTRAFSLLIGAFLAFIWPWQKFQNKSMSVNKKKIWYFDIAGLISIFGLILIMIFISGLSNFMYLGILLLGSIFSAIIITNLVIPNSKLNKVFSLKPLVWIGKRSYGMYLWHFPIILIINQVISEDSLILLNYVVSISLVLIISSLQYKYIEDPIRNGLLGRKFKQIKKNKFKISKKDLIIITIPVCLCFICIIGTIFVPDEYSVPRDQIVNNDEDIQHATQKEGKYYPTLIADSITGAIKLWNFFPYSINDSEVGRNTTKGIEKLREYSNKNVIDDVVICSFFNNNVLKESELEEIADIVGPDKHLFLVNTYTGKDISIINNETISKFVEGKDNIQIIDWYSVVGQNPQNYLYKDNTHLNIQGQALFIQTIAEAVNDYLPDNTKCDISKISENINKLQ